MIEIINDNTRTKSFIYIFFFVAVIYTEYEFGERYLLFLIKKFKLRVTEFMCIDYIISTVGIHYIMSIDC